jgi:uncharacterized protein YlxW (UPF0749 family)
MTGDHEGGPSVRPRGRRGAWRIGTPLVVLLSGGLFAVSYANSEGTDLRPGRYADMASLAEAEKDEYDELTREVAELSAEVESLTGAVDVQEVKELRRQVEELDGPAGLEPATGPGVTVTMSDAPNDRVDAARQDGVDLNRLVVHQQDVQAVVNAMWQGGAEAVTIQGQRVVTTTGIKCEGNAVLIQGVPFPQPYVIQAVGDPSSIQSAIDRDDDISAYRSDAAIPSIGIGWDLESEDQIEAPAYDGLLDINHAKPIR